MCLLLQPSSQAIPMWALIVVLRLWRSLGFCRLFFCGCVCFCGFGSWSVPGPAAGLWPPVGVRSLCLGPVCMFLLWVLVPPWPCLGPFGRPCASRPWPLVSFCLLFCAAGCVCAVWGLALVFALLGVSCWSQMGKYEKHVQCMFHNGCGICKDGLVHSVGTCASL